MQKGKILVLEDNKEISEIIVAILSEFGREILCFSDPTLAFLAEKNFGKDIELFIFDINLPSYSGIEVGQLIKKISPSRKMICVSGNIDQHEEALKGLHPEAIIQKPFVSDELISRVKKALEKLEK